MGTEPAMMRLDLLEVGSLRQLGGCEAVFDVLRVSGTYDRDVHSRIRERPCHSELGDRATQLLGGESLQLIDDL